MGFTQAEAQAILDLRFPTSAATDAVAWSTNGTSEFAGIARTAIGATGWAAATAASPSVKANNAILTSAGATAGGTVTHFAVWSATSGGTQRTEWQALDTPRTVVIGDLVRAAIGAIKIRL